MVLHLGVYAHQKSYNSINNIFFFKRYVKGLKFFYFIVIIKLLGEEKK